jgi:hypothetical protein
MEYVVVSFPTDRIVYIDGEQNGRTNKSLRVDAGSHEFDLGPFKNYEPESQVVVVSGTTVLDPQEIAFTKTGP